MTEEDRRKEIEFLRRYVTTGEQSGAYGGFYAPDGSYVVTAASEGLLWAKSRLADLESKEENASQ